MAVQVAKHIYGAEKVVSSVSTPKISLVPDLLPPGTVDQLIDYQTQDIVRTLGPGTVDCVFNTQMSGYTALFPLAKPNTGGIVSIASLPSAASAQNMMGSHKTLPFWLRWILQLAYVWYNWNLRGTNVRQDFVSGNPAAREDAELEGEYIAQGKIVAVKTVVNLEDIDELRRRAQMVATGKGGVGCLVIIIKKDE